MSSAPIELVFGAAFIAKWTDDLGLAFDLLDKHNVTTIDTARLYEESEKTLGQVKAGDRFKIDTKFPGGVKPGYATRENIVKSVKESLDTLGIKQIDILYMHAPDTKTPLEETLAGINEVHKLGYIKRFGLSNYLAADVEKACAIAKENGWILPTVYQGNYGPLTRLQESLLFPTLRKLGIAFYSYGTLAAGFLTKTREQIEAGQGRFNEDFSFGIWKAMYYRPSYLDALAKWGEIADEEGVSRAELAFRWVAYNSPLSREHGDAIIIGASNLKQLDQVLTGIGKGKLSPKAEAEIEKVWEDIKHEAPLDAFNDFQDRAAGSKARFEKK